MDVGLLWYDADPKRRLEDKIGRAAQRYREKYGRWPNTCYVHRQAVDGRNGERPRACRLPNSRAVIQIISAPNILQHHLWLGESKEVTAPKRKRAAKVG